MLELHNIRFWIMFLLVSIAGTCGNAIGEQTFYGLADASAAVFLNADHFVIADDESNVLHIYRIDQSAKPVSSLDLNVFLGVSSEPPEADIEAVAKGKARIYWITSHGRNKNGKLRPNRYRFFSMRIDIPAKASLPPRLVPTGVPCQNLVDHLVKHTSIARQAIANATRFDEKLSKKDRQKLAPKNKGLNIEGLVYYPPNDSLLIGLRNPLFTAGRAIIFELKNPAEVIDKKQSPVFGHTMLWDLKGRGIRGMEYSGYHKQYFILAGAIDDETTPALYHWDGTFNSAPVMLYQWPPSTPSFTPEGIATAPDTGRLWIFSDDGSVEVKVGSASECMEGELLANGRCLNKHLKNNAQRTYRVEQIDPAELKRKF